MKHQFWLMKLRNTSILNEMVLPPGLLTELSTEEELEMPGGERYIICQIKDCTFQTDRLGLRRGEAAKHLMSHGIRKDDIKRRGQFFKSVGKSKNKN